MSGETEQAPSSWTIDSLAEHVKGLLAETDKRLEQRYVASQEAITAAFQAQEKAVAAALAAAEKAVTAALAAADRAVAKAEMAADKRFEAVNEFRAQLADQAATFMPRVEAEARTQVVTDKVDEVRRQLAEQAIAFMPRGESEARVKTVTSAMDQIHRQVAETMSRAELEARLLVIAEKVASNSSKLDKLEGRTSGMNASWAVLVGIVGLVATAAGIIAAAVAATGH